MEKFKIPVRWCCHSEIEVKADSLDEAVDMVNLGSDEIVLPQDWDLEEGSIEVNFGAVEDFNPGYKLDEDSQRRELEAKDFGIIDKGPQKVEEICDDEEREARRNLAQLGEGYEEDTEEEGGDEEG